MIVRQRGRVRESMSMCASVSVWLVERSCSCDMIVHEEHEQPFAAQCRVLSWRRRASVQSGGLGSDLCACARGPDGGREVLQLVALLHVSISCYCVSISVYF